MAMKVEFINKETIKPSSPTPHHLRILNLSFLDQWMMPRYGQTIHFYPNNSEFPNKCQLLKTSLSNVLTHFYPFAGRIKQNMIIECNDDGIEFFEARIHGSLSDMLKNPCLDSFNQFFPIELNSFQSLTGPLLLIQATFFDCGGMAIGVSISHKIADASTMSSFMKAWSAIALGCMDEALCPSYVLGSIFPSIKDFENNSRAVEIKKFECKIVTRRFVFCASKIADLKAKSASATMKPPTRVEAVLALIWNCITNASRLRLSNLRPSLLSQVVNIRKRLVPPLPKNTVGNCFCSFIVEVDAKTKMDRGNLTIQLKKGLEEVSNNLLRNQAEGKLILAIRELKQKMGNALKDSGKDLYSCSSWCGISLHECDFGWGKPKWVAVPPFDLKDVISLIDTSDGQGIEAWISLSEEHMIILENDEELLQFASLNPPIKLD